MSSCNFVPQWIEISVLICLSSLSLSLMFFIHLDSIDSPNHDHKYAALHSPLFLVLYVYVCKYVSIYLLLTWFIYPSFIFSQKVKHCFLICYFKINYSPLSFGATVIMDQVIIFTWPPVCWLHLSALVALIFVFIWLYNMSRCRMRNSKFALLFSKLN